MNKNPRIGIIGTPGYVEKTFSMSTEEVYRHCGNTGNLAFRYAVSEHIASSKKYFYWHSDPTFVRESCDLIVFPAANQIDPRLDLTRWANFLEKVNLPCLLVGLGSQSSTFDPELHLKLNKGTVRFLNIISERSQKIGVRGSYTVEVLAKLGINNTLTLGCPSLFINPISNLGVIIKDKFISHPRNIAITDSAARQHLKYVERKLIEWMCRYNGKYICQSPPEIVSLARHRFDEIPINWLKRFHQYLLPYLSYDEFIIFVKKYFIIFFNIDAWLEFLSSCDFCLGTRMHGTILGIQALTPSVCISHDSRTQELCETMKIPNISKNKFLAVNDIEELIDIISFDALEFDKNRLKLAQQYKDLLTSYSIKISDNLNKLGSFL